MTETLENLFLFISIYIPLLPFVSLLLLLFIQKRTVILLTFSVVALYSLAELLTNLIADRVTNLAEYRTVYSIFTAVEYGLFSLIYFLVIRSRLVRKALIITSIAFFIFWTLYRIYGTYNVLDSIPIGVETIIILLFTFWFFLEQMDNVKDGFIYNKPVFWIVAGIMIYLAGSFFCYILANQVDEKTRNIYWMFTNIFNSIKCSFFIVAMVISFNKEHKKASYSLRPLPTIL